jgi:hypothetical protein
VTIPLPEPVKHAVNRFLEMVDSETVRLFLWPFYFALLCWGVYASFFAAPIQFVYPVMGRVLYDVWVWIFIPASLFVMIGLAIRHGGKSLAEMTTPMLFTDYVGLWMQLGGHVSVFFAATAFEVSAIKAAPWGLAAFPIFLLAPYVPGCLFLAVQTGRKLWQGEALHQATK